MPHIPAFEANRAKDYVFFVGENIGHVSLWKRYGETEGPVPETYVAEYPVFQNTRGRGLWISSDPETANQPQHKPTDAFWEALASIIEGPEKIDVRDCEWYEREVISSVISILNNEDGTPEIGELLHYARRKANGGLDDA